jgi:hypothetical protein
VKFSAHSRLIAKAIRPGAYESNRFTIIARPAATEEKIEALESRVRRAYGRVERNHPGSKQFKPKPLSEEDKLLLQAVTYGAILIPS